MNATTVNGMFSSLSSRLLTSVGACWSKQSVWPAGVAFALASGGAVACGGPSAPFDNSIGTTTATMTTTTASVAASVANPGPQPVAPVAPAALIALPAPPSPGNVPVPAGTPGGVQVLDWAGFTAAVSYTFDDTNSSQIEHYPELNALGVRMTFYLITNKADFKDPIWVQALADGHELGNHTRTHPEDDDGADVDAATVDIETQFGVPPQTMAAPYGKPVYADLAETRFFINRGVSNGLVGPKDNTNPFNLYCFIPNEGALAGDFNEQLDEAVEDKKWRIVLVHGFAGGSDQAYQPVEVGEFVAAVQYAKDKQNVWIDSVVNVGAYWLGQKAFDAATVTTNGAEQTWTWTLPPHFPAGHVLRVTATGGKLSQNGTPLAWDSRGYYEVSLDAKTLTLSP